MDEVVLASEHGLMIKEIIYGSLGLSRGLLRRMKNGGKVCLNGKPAFITQRVKAGDRFRYILPIQPPNCTPANEVGYCLRR